MNAHADHCDHRRIDACLSDERSQTLHADLIEHLDVCDACRTYMEARAAPPEDWTQTAELLRPTAFDHAGSVECSAALLGHHHIDRPAIIQSVIDALTPSDDPRHLGRLDGYEITGVIGAGGMGVVLKAVDPSLDRVVAVKVMATHLANSVTARKRFAREAKAAAAVLHPNVIPIHCVSSQNATPYLVMAYIRGGSLQKRIERDGPLSTIEILRIGAQIAAGLAVAHEQGLVHRDIKPENILLEDGVERVTLTDFGLARAVDDTSITQHGTIAGTPRYMSPEQARGESIDQRSDLFSLGSVLYTLCTGQPPFRAPTTLGVMRRICEEAPTPILERNPDIPEWLAAIVERLLAKRKEERFETAHEVKTLLESCLSHVQQPTLAPLPQMNSIRGEPTAAKNRRPTHLQTRLGARIMAVLSILGIAVISIALVRGNGINPQNADDAPAKSQDATPTGESDAWSLGHGYARQGDAIYFKGRRIDQAGQENLAQFARTIGRPLTLAHDVDAASFAALSEEYAKDKNKVYYKWISPGQFWVVVIPDADPETFEVMDFNLAKDANRVWRTDTPIIGADAATARVVNPHWVWKDKRTVYYQFTPLPKADPATFRHLDQAFYRDANHVYWGTTRLADADVNTFQTFGNDVPYAADEHHVWVAQNRLPHVDASTFRLLHNHVFADESNVYVGGDALVVPDADAATFRKVAELESARCVLFRDDARHHIYDPHYNEVYTLTEADGAVEIRKPVWSGSKAGAHRRAATVAATWNDGALSEPTVDMLPGFENGPRPHWEVGKMQRMADPIRESLHHMGLDAGVAPVAEAAEADDAPADEVVEAEKAADARRRANLPWNTDVEGFDAHLATLTENADVPTIENLTRRLMADVVPITKGNGGFVDLKPAPGDVQHAVNEALKGRAVKWRIKLAAAETDMYGVTALFPDLGHDINTRFAEAAPDEIPHLAMIMMRKPDRAADAGAFKAGDIIIVEGTIGDASTNKGLMVTSFVGPVAIYHLNDVGRPIFWLGLVDAKITRAASD